MTVGPWGFWAACACALAAWLLIVVHRLQGSFDMRDFVAVFLGSIMFVIWLVTLPVAGVHNWARSFL